MKTLSRLFALALFVFPSLAYGTCTGVFPPGTVCNNAGSASGSGTPTKDIVLGQSGANTGSVTFNNGTSGSIKLTPPASGPLSTTILTFPVGSNTLATLGAQTFSGIQTFSVPPVFTDQSGSRTALGLGTIATQAASGVAITGGSITGLSAPSLTSDAATKGYVDGLVAGFHVLNALEAATTTALPNTPTYDNGTAGVGATLTAGSNGALTVDGISLSTSNSILVKDQADQTQNGVYDVTDAGSGSTPYILTRNTSANTPTDLTNAYVLIVGGTVNSSSGWVSNSVTTIGSDNIIFHQFSSPSGVASVGGLSGVVGIGAGLTTSGSDLVVNQTSTYTWTGDHYFGSGRPWCDVRAMGAVGDGTTDDTSAFQACDTALSATAGTIFVPPGTYCIKTGPVVMNVVGESLVSPPFGVILRTCGVDKTVLKLTKALQSVIGPNIEGLGYPGDATSFSLPTQPTVLINASGGGCNFCIISKTAIYGGATGISFSNPTANGEFIVEDSIISNNYSYSVYTANASGFLRRVKMDTNWPCGAPASTSIPTWASGTVYAAGAIANVSGYVLQTCSGGTSGGSAPSVAFYGNDITDNTVTWQLAMPLNFIPLFMDTGTVEIYGDMLDVTGAGQYGIVANASGLFFDCHNCVLGQQTDSGLHIVTATKIELVGNNMSSGAKTGASVIDTGTGFTGLLQINGGEIVGGTYGIGIQGGKTIIANAYLSATSFQIAVANAASHISIRGNTFGSGTPFACSGASDYLIIQGNDTSGVGFTNACTGTHTSITGNL